MAITVEPAVRTDFVILPDARRLSWSEWGPADGTPLIFCTGAGMSGALGFGMSGLDALQIRLMAIDRPGLGRSDPHPGKTLASWAEDVAALIDQRELRQPAALGFSQGAPFALAIAASGLVCKLAIVAGQDDLGHADIRPRLGPEISRMVMQAREDPAGFERWTAEAASADWLWQMIINMSSTADRQLYQTEPFSSLYQTSLREGFAQGASGYARDLTIALGEWPFSVESIRVPAHLWYGSTDASPVHSPDFGQTMASRLPGARLIVDEAAGGSILWTRSADILHELHKGAFEPGGEERLIAQWPDPAQSSQGEGM